MATFVTRTTADGAKRIKAMVRRKNSKPATQTFSSRREAEAWALQVEGAIVARQQSPHVEAMRHTAAEAIERYLEFLPQERRRRAKDVVAQLSFWKRQIGHQKLSAISPFEICRIRDELARGKTVQNKPRQPATVNRYLSALGPVFTAAVKDWGWMPESPMSRVRKLKEPRGRLEYLTQEQRDELLSHCGERLRLIVLLALCTGMRRGELVGLRRTDVDLPQRRIVLQHTKNGDRRSIPITPTLFDILSEHVAKLAPDELLFPSPKKGYERQPWDFTQAWNTAVKAAKLKHGFRFHDLRHSCATYLAMNGATTSEIAEVLGHKTLQMVKRYAHLSPSHVASVLADMNSRIVAGQF